MADSDISDLIRELQDIAAIIIPLIKKQLAIGGRIDEKIHEVRKHHSDCNIARSFGAGASTAGGSLIAASTEWQETDGSTAGCIGLAVTVVGKLVSLFTDIADEVQSKSFIEEVKEIVASQNHLSEELREKLDEFQLFLSWSSISRKLLRDIGFNPGVRFSRHRSQLFVNESDMCGYMTTDIDCDYLVNNSLRRVDEIKRAADVRANLEANRYHRNPQVRGITAGSHPTTLSTNRVTSSSALLPTIASTLREIGTEDDIGAVIEGWTNKHRIEEAMIEFRKRLKKSTAALLNLLRDIEESVQLLEKTLMQMRSPQWLYYFFRGAGPSYFSSGQKIGRPLNKNDGNGQLTRRTNNHTGVMFSVNYDPKNTDKTFRVHGSGPTTVKATGNTGAPGGRTVQRLPVNHRRQPSDDARAVVMLALALVLCAIAVYFVWIFWAFRSTSPVWQRR